MGRCEKILGRRTGEEYVGIVELRYIGSFRERVYI